MELYLARQAQGWRPHLPGLMVTACCVLSSGGRAAALTTKNAFIVGCTHRHTSLLCGHVTTCTLLSLSGNHITS